MPFPCNDDDPWCTVRSLLYLATWFISIRTDLARSALTSVGTDTGEAGALTHCEHMYFDVADPTQGSLEQ